MIRICCWAFVVAGLGCVVWLTATSCDNANVVGTVPYTDTNADVITWDDDLAGALCRLGYCGIRITNHPIGVAIPEGVETRVFGRVIHGQFELASDVVSGRYVCDPVTDIQCWWVRYEIAPGMFWWSKRCTYGDCPAPPQAP